MNTPGDVRTRFEMAMNENFKKAVARLASMEDQVGAMSDQHIDSISGEIQKTADYVERFSPISVVREYFTTTKGFSEGDFKKIENILKTEDESSLAAIIAYIKDPKDIKYFTSITKSDNIVNKISKDTGIGTKFLSQLFSMDGAMKSGKGVGRGELFLGFMIKGATNASVGDVNADGQPFEVKAKEARLNTMNGFGNGMAAITNFFDGLSKYDKDLADQYRPKTKKEFAAYNYKKKTPSMFYFLMKTAADKGLDFKKIYEIQANTMYCSTSGIWPNGDNKIKKMVVDNFMNNVNSDGSQKDNAALNYEFMYINILYYQSQEFFNGLFLIEPDTGNFAYFDPSIGKKRGISWLTKYTTYYQPSWQDNPTSNSWKISLK